MSVPREASRTYTLLTHTLLKIEVWFEVVSALNRWCGCLSFVGVRGSVPRAASKSKCQKSVYMGLCRKCCWVVSLGPSLLQITIEQRKQFNWLLSWLVSKDTTNENCCVRPADHNLGSSLERHFGNLEEKRGWAAWDKEGTKTKLSAQGSIFTTSALSYKRRVRGPIPAK